MSAVSELLTTENHFGTDAAVFIFRDDPERFIYYLDEPVKSDHLATGIGVN